MNVLCGVFARGGSKGVPGKNLRLLAGRSLLARAVETGRQVPGVLRTVVSTDSSAIAHEAEAAGAEAPFLRPAELATDAAPERLAWRHLVAWARGQPEGFDTLLSLPPTAPFRTVDDAARCLEGLRRHPDADICITYARTDQNPYFNMVVPDPDGSLRLALDGRVTRRQEAPPVYAVTTVAYAARFEGILRDAALFDGRVVGVEVPRERALDIDSEIDWAFAEFLAQRGGGL